VETPIPGKKTIHDRPDQRRTLDAAPDFKTKAEREAEEPSRSAATAAQQHNQHAKQQAPLQPSNRPMPTARPIDRRSTSESGHPDHAACWRSEG